MGPARCDHALGFRGSHLWEMKARPTQTDFPLGEGLYEHGFRGGDFPLFVRLFI